MYWEDAMFGNEELNAFGTGSGLYSYGYELSEPAQSAGGKGFTGTGGR